jgi:GNAT superfamily N-acetyltransferase
MATTTTAPTAVSLLRDGSTVHVRRSDPDDEVAVVQLLRSLSIHSRATRFGTAAVDLLSAARGAVKHSGVIAMAPDGQCVGHAWYVRTTDRHAEMAVVVADSYQGRGLGTILVKSLAALASCRGIEVLEVYVLADNVRMTDVLRECGIPVRSRADPGGQRFELEIA